MRSGCQSPEMSQLHSPLVTQFSPFHEPHCTIGETETYNVKAREDPRLFLCRMGSGDSEVLELI